MEPSNRLPSWKDKALYTPGPLTTSQTIKLSMLRDFGSRDDAFIEIVRDVRQRLLAIAKLPPEEYTVVLMQGSGTFGIEAVISSVIPPDGKLLILINGAYGERILRIASIHGIANVPIRFAENSVPDPYIVESVLSANKEISHVAVIHCETTTGIINPIDHYGEIIKKYDCAYIVDAMSSFGAYPINIQSSGIDYLISSSNKNIEGVPGFSFTIARRKVLEASRGSARTLSLDVHAQLDGLDRDGQFRFTPPTHAILAFHQALVELDQEGGIPARANRYRRNHEWTLSSMERMGFKPYLLPEDRGYIITAFHYPDHPNFNFQNFYQRLSEKGHVIYPGKLSHADCFRIGHIGRLGIEDVEALMTAISVTLQEMDISLVD